jgi:hypothetical protein
MASRLQVANPVGESESPFPYKAAGTEAELYPPVCLRSHFDPTAMLRLILPNQQVQLPMDFRPYTKVCKDYVTSAPAIEAPLPPTNMVFPSGGQFYPPGRYSEHINDESKLHYLDRRLDRWCQKKEYVPPTNSDMYVPNSTVVRTAAPNSAFVSELAMPQAVLRESDYYCRKQNDIVNWDRSPRLFSNPTKQDKWGSETYSSLRGGVLVFPHGDSQPVPPTAQAVAGRQVVGSMNQFGVIQMPGGQTMPPQAGLIRPLVDAGPDRRPVRVAGISTAERYAPA